MSLKLKDLRESNEFLNVLLDNIASAVMIVDNDFRIRQFNDALTRIFGKEGREYTGEACGDALGCIFAAKEKAPCGKTSQCHKCQLRKNLAKTFSQRSSCRRKMLARSFYLNEVPVQKFIEFSTRYISFNGQEFALLIMDDITERELQKQELIRKQKQIELDLKAAASIQRTLLPSRQADFHHVYAVWEFLPCSTIGGDIFNLLQLGKGRMACFMMDASGHGVHSALVSVSVSQLLQPGSTTLPLDSPAAVCEELDRQFPLERFNTFFSMIYIVLDLKARTLRWCNAGHPPGALRRSGGEVELLDATGPIIGLGGMLPFMEKSKRIKAGERIFLCTDGLIERRNQAGDLFGVKGFLAGIETTGGGQLAATLSTLIRTALDFGEGTAVSDDISLLALEIR